MKTPSRQSFLRIGLLAGAMAATYILGRWPGPLAKWEGKLPAAWQRLISKTWTVPAASAPTMRTEEDKPTPLLTLKQAMNRLSEIMKGKSMGDNGLAVYKVFENMNPGDKAALFKMISDLPASHYKWMLLQNLIGSVGNDDNNLVLALSLSEKIENDQWRGDMISISLAYLSDPDRATWANLQFALGELAKLPPTEVNPNMYGDLLDGWAKLHPAEVEAIAEQLPAGAARNGAIEGVATSLAGTDPQAAINWLQSLPPGDDLPWNGVLNAVVGQDPTLAASYLDKVTGNSDRATLIQQIFSGLANGPSGDPAAALDWLKQTDPTSTFNQTIEQYISNPATSQQDPAAAATLVNDITDPLARLTATTNLAASWGAADPQAALAWAANVTDNGSITRNDTLRSVVSSWATINPAAATAYIQNSPDPSLYLSLAPAIAQTWAASELSTNPTYIGVYNPPQAWTGSDPAAALTWVNTLPDSDAKSQALGNVLAGVAKTDFTTAWDDASNLPATDNPEAIMGNLVSVEAQQNPAQAAALLSQLPADATQLSATTAVATTWAQQDPQALSNWINTLSPGAERDTSVEQLVAAQINKDPAGSFTWANTLASPDLRATQIQTVLTSWAGTDLTAALNAVQTANLTDAQRAALTQTLTKVQATSSP